MRKEGRSRPGVEVVAGARAVKESVVVPRVDMVSVDDQLKSRNSVVTKNDIDASGRTHDSDRTLNVEVTTANGNVRVLVGRDNVAVPVLALDCRYVPEWKVEVARKVVADGRKVCASVHEDTAHMPLALGRMAGKGIVLLLTNRKVVTGNSSLIAAPAAATVLRWLITIRRRTVALATPHVGFGACVTTRSPVLDRRRRETLLSLETPLLWVLLLSLLLWTLILVTFLMTLFAGLLLLGMACIGGLTIARL